MDVTYELTYTTEQLIDRGYAKLKLLNSQNEKKAFFKPEIINHNRKSYITNYMKFCDSINREPEHLQKYIDHEMNASTSIVANGSMNDEKSGLKFNMMFKKDIIMNTVTGYMKEYVLCSLCKSGNTEIKKIDRINFLKCNNCKADKAIANK
jgi:translation initiation factor 2 subunit 2